MFLIILSIIFLNITANFINKRLLKFKVIHLVILKKHIDLENNKYICESGKMVTNLSYRYELNTIKQFKFITNEDTFYNNSCL